MPLEPSLRTAVNDRSYMIQVAIFEILRLRASPNRLLVVGVSHFKASTAGDALRQRQVSHSLPVNHIVPTAGPRRSGGTQYAS